MLNWVAETSSSYAMLFLVTRDNKQSNVTKNTIIVTKYLKTSISNYMSVDVWVSSLTGLIPIGSLTAGKLIVQIFSVFIRYFASKSLLVLL